MTSLELQLFGPPRIRRDGAVVRFDTRKAAALLAVLAVSGREHGRDALAGLLWPELDRVRARAALRRTLSVASAVGPALHITPEGAQLTLDDVWCDVIEFRRSAHASDEASWVRAAQLATDAFLEGFALRDSPVFEDWQIATSDSLRDLASQNLGRLVAHSVRSADLDAALSYARQRIHIEPLSEPAHADLIRVTAWSGDRPAALTAYRALVRLLESELGVAPLPETMALHAAIRAGTLAPPSAAPAEHPPRPADDARRAVALHGRDDLLRKLDAAWRAAADGGGAVGLVGEHGIGKTALVHELSSRVNAAGARVLRLTGHAAERGLAYAAGTDLVRAVLALEPGLPGELGPTGLPLAVLATEVDGAGSRSIRSPGDLQRLHEAVRAALAAFSRNRALIVVDDAHLVDLPSAALLAYVTRRLPRGLLVVATWAAGAGGAPVPAAITEAGAVLGIAPLDIEAVAAVIDGRDADPAEVLRRTRGVPLLVTEFATSGSVLDAPDGVRDVVTARFEAASPTTRQLIGAAAVVGTVADPELLRVACGRDESETVDAIEEGISLGLLVERADRPGYDVPHEVVREVALSWLSLARARLLHGRVADLLARRHAIDPLATPAGAVARHLAQAGRDEDAVSWFLVAAEEASRLYAHAEALEQLRSARALGYRPLDVHQLTGATLVRLGLYDDALVSLDRACALAEDDPVRQAAIEHAIAGVYDRLGEPALALAHLEAARDLSSTNRDATDARPARILADLALVHHRSGRPDDAERAAHDAVALAHELADEAAMAQGANVLGVITAARGHYPEATEHVLEASQRARAAGDLDLVIAALNNLSRVRQLAGDDDGALGAAREALEEAERQGDRHRLAALHSHLADLLHAAGRDDEAVAALKNSAAAFADVQEARSRPEVWTLTEW